MAKELLTFGEVVKNYFEDNLVPYTALKTAQGDVAPSGSDALAEDWFIC